MKHTDVRSWLLAICTFRRSHVKTLSVLVYAAMETVRLTLAELGRTVARQRGQSVKHCIKRVDRFLGNGRIEPAIANVWNDCCWCWLWLTGCCWLWACTPEKSTPPAAGAPITELTNAAFSPLAEFSSENDCQPSPDFSTP